MTKVSLRRIKSPEGLRMTWKGNNQWGGELGRENQSGNKKNLNLASSLRRLQNLGEKGLRKLGPGPSLGKVIFAQCPTKYPT